ncbi:hypothetical protein NX10_25740 [Pseudomonas fluorescens]|nr:hypothetical protein NX10_25740 [Pseudomonas fluorescens]
MRVVVAVAQLAAVGIGAAADEVQVVSVFVAGDAAELVAFGSDAAIRVVGKRTCGAAGQGDLSEAVDGIPLVLGDRSEFILASDLSAERIVAILALTAIGQALFQQLAEVVLTRLLRKR